jgi:tRNA wybutosine-synthesizing protein 5
LIIPKIISLSLFRTLNFCDLIKRASSNEKLTEYFLSENEKYYLRSLGDDERKDISNIKFIIYSSK